MHLGHILSYASYYDGCLLTWLRFFFYSCTLVFCLVLLAIAGFLLYELGFFDSYTSTTFYLMPPTVACFFHIFRGGLWTLITFALSDASTNWELHHHMVDQHHHPQSVQYGWPMIVLYIEGISIIVNLVSIILEQCSSLNVTCRLLVTRGEIESLVNPISKEVRGVRLLVENLSF